MQKESKLKHIAVELIHHLPFSIFGVSLGLLMMGALTFLAIVAGGEELLPDASHELFHVFHASHILFSAIATTAMFWKHDRNLLKAITVGFIGSISICGLSDAIFPYIGGIVLGADMHAHICLIEHPQLVLIFAAVGVMAGLSVAQSFEKSTEYSHSAHVFISSAASILYLTAYGLNEWVHAISGVFIVILLAVMLPCCLSDIVFPLACAHRVCDCSETDKRHHH